MFKKQPKTADEVVVAFQSMIDNLGVIAEVNRQKVDEQNEKIKQAEREKQKALSEANKASRIANKIGDLLKE